jgi:hypothetical protein
MRFSHAFVVPDYQTTPIYGFLRAINPTMRDLQLQRAGIAHLDRLLKAYRYVVSLRKNTSQSK